MKPDFCSLCEAVRIIGYDKDYKPYELPQYAEHFIKLNNDSLLKLGVCSDCRMTLISGGRVKENAEKLLEAYKRWLRSIPGQNSDFEGLTITNPNSSENEYRLEKVREEMLQNKNLEKQKRAHREMVNVEQPVSEDERKKRAEEFMDEEKSMGEKIYQSIVFF